MSLKKNRRASISEITTEIYVEKNSDDESNVYNNIASVQSVDNYKILLGDLKKVIDMKKRNEGFKKEYEVSCIHTGHTCTSHIDFSSRITLIVKSVIYTIEKCILLKH